MEHVENTGTKQLLLDLSLTEAGLIMNALLALNHNLLDELADYANRTDGYGHFLTTKERLVAVSSMIDRITTDYAVVLMRIDEE